MLLLRHSLITLLYTRTGIAAGSPIPIDLMKNLIGRMNLRDLTNAYGMSKSFRTLKMIICAIFLLIHLISPSSAETSPVSFQTTPDDPIIKRVETVGKVQPHVKAKIIDLDGNVVDIGKPGEICIAGYLLQKGYAVESCKTVHVNFSNQHLLFLGTGKMKNKLSA